jgi:uncharacterized membrane protein (UPF0127 family)
MYFARFRAKACPCGSNSVFEDRNAVGRLLAFAARAVRGVSPARPGRPWPGIVLVFALGLALASGPAPAADLHTLEIVSNSGVHVFSVELAVTDAERARGLMFRRELPEGQGMLFDFGREEAVAMWMKNTLIPLDMMFITGSGRILRIAENTEPMSTRIIASGGPVRAVLEVIGGTAKKYGIAAGDRVAHPWFR